MYLTSRMLYLYVETPLHAGTGAGLGAVDLPIQRERTTGYPIVQASGLKGALRSAMPEGDPDTEAVFGPDSSRAELHAGAFSPGDARILLFPVRSLKGVFAWTTSLHALRRWQREARYLGFALPDLPTALPEQLEGEETPCYAAPGVTTPDGYVVLEEFAYKVQVSPTNEQNAAIVPALASWLGQNLLPDTLGQYWKNQLADKLVILPDEDFRDFVNYATEVLTRIRLEPDTKTVARGALWTEEHLPADSLLYAPMRATRLRMNKNQFPAAWDEFKEDAEGQASKVLDWVQEKVPARLQIGGDETLGRGIVSLRWNTSEVQV